MPKKKKASVRIVAPVLHIYCEGEKTEPNYLNGYLQNLYAGDRRRTVVRVEATRKNTPIQLIDVAIQSKKRYPDLVNDVFWVVYDREAIGKYSDQLHEIAYQKAKTNGINIAMSNVCFELWLLLHFKDNTAPYSCFNDLITSSDLKAELAKVGIQNYEKGSRSIFDCIKDRISEARTRSHKMKLSTTASAPIDKSKPYQLNPYTDMHLLLDAIDNF